MQAPLDEEISADWAAVQALVALIRKALSG
jgi:hypothetical protein